MKCKGPFYGSTRGSELKKVNKTENRKTQNRNKLQCYQWGLINLETELNCNDLSSMC